MADLQLITARRRFRLAKLFSPGVTCCGLPSRLTCSPGCSLKYTSATGCGGGAAFLVPPAQMARFAARSAAPSGFSAPVTPRYFALRPGHRPCRRSARRRRQSPAAPRRRRRLSSAARIVLRAVTAPACRGRGCRVGGHQQVLRAAAGVLTISFSSAIGRCNSSAISSMVCGRSSGFSASARSTVRSSSGE